MSIQVSQAHPSKFRLLFPHLPFLPETADGKTEKGDSLLLYCSEVTLPDLSVEADVIPNQTYDSKFATRNISYGDMDVTFTVDGDFTNYKFLFKWMMYLKHPERFEVRQEKVDATLMIYSSNDNPRFKFVLKNIFPVALAGISFDKKISDAEDLLNTVTFAMEYYLIEEF